MMFRPTDSTSPSWSRRNWLHLSGLALLGITTPTQSADALLPPAQSLADDLARALKKKQSLIVMVSLEGCVFCRQVRQSHLLPLQKDGQIVVQVDIRNNHSVLDFSGQHTTHDQLTRQWKVSVTPTLLFFGPGGKEVAERMTGSYLPDFYGAYLEDRLAQGRQAR
jgi:thioredoxin-related protein